MFSLNVQWSIVIYIVYRLVLHFILGSIVVSIPACHAGDRGSIPRRGGNYFTSWTQTGRALQYLNY